MSTEGRQINKSAIRNFAIEARNILIRSAITQAGFYGITKEEIKSPIQRGRDFEVYETLTGAEKRIFDSDVKRRATLVEAIHQKGFDEVMEETAYTWFNRLIAIRFMEVNNYLPFRMRVLSSDSGSMTPDIVNKSLEVNLNLTEKELTEIQTAKDENNYDEAFRLLFIKTCNELNDILPGLFEKTDDYMELLLKLPYTSDGVVRMLVDTIPESNFNVNEGGQVEIIGWLYQYYNTEPKAKAFAKKGKITKEEIPAVTQLFTPDWIVRYMVENSLGRLWVEHLLANGDSRSEQEIANDFGWKYYLPEAEQEPEVQAQLVRIRAERKNLTPEDILCIDPCQGSGHILVYLFEVLMQIYREDGYSARDAARCILEQNLYGLDIDDRAYQLSYFAVLMKAKQYDRMILKKHIQPHVYSIQESNSVNRNQLKYFGADMSTIERNNAVNQLTGLLETFKDAKEYGSILKVDRYDWDLLRRFAENDRVEGQMDFEAYGVDQIQKQLITLIEIGKAMAQKYHAVVTNPPYMVLSNGNEKLNHYTSKYYPESKYDLFAVFIEKCAEVCATTGVFALITQQAWMFQPTFKKLRNKIEINTVISMLHLGARAFDEIAGEVVQTVSFVYCKKEFPDYIGTYIRLTDLQGELNKERAFSEHERWYYAKKEIFSSIPNKPLAYWVSDRFAAIFSNPCIKEWAISDGQTKTGNNDKYLRNLWEVEYTKIGKGKKWALIAKGGLYRKWAGNIDTVIDWSIDARRHYREDHVARIAPEYIWFRKGVSWNHIGSRVFAARYLREDCLFETAAPSVFFEDDEKLLYIIGYLNSVISNEVLKFINPTLSTNVGDITIQPIAFDKENFQEIVTIVKETIGLSQADWDLKETSYNYKRNPLINAHRTIENSFNSYKDECNERFNNVHKNERRINELFISVFNLEDELSPDVDENLITVRKATKSDAIRELMSFAVGCMFGRYSLDVLGLAYAGGNWKEAYATKYKTFMPDEDAIIPITDEEYFKDDIVARFVDFIRIVYGEETLEENLQFIADALGNKGNTSRAVIRNYFLNDFYKDHCKTYSVTGSGKRPIYWLFDSGKQNGFKALIYIHRYTPDTVGLIRSVYLHNAQAAIQNSLKNSEYIISTTTSATERARETKKKDKYMKQLNELRPYYQALSHIALQRIPLDLDNGVKKNYQLFQGVEISSEGKKKQTINLLAKI